MEEMRRKCPICRAMIPPSKEMATTLLAYQARKQEGEDNNDTSSKDYCDLCAGLERIGKKVGADWDGVTVLEDNNDKPPVVMPDYIYMASRRGDTKTVLKWINANQTEDRANATSSAETATRKYDQHELANLLESELGGRSCEVVNLSSRPELNGKTCVTDEYLLGAETSTGQPQAPGDCRYYVEFKNGCSIRHDFDWSEECKAFVAALNSSDETPTAVTEEEETRTKQAAAELLAELGLDSSPKY
ncbi:hypothetical protein THAOC_35101 [Thalassiosira oceanica]|uniref:Uncharacterized protein n=1 Tax=Thalassiosira oceanica TaxID=159749 RepID=K0RI26_THAOC|nr:hypothetical protein THAOC_35101 [Thalassiosira oceanica]|eukprot:EJK46242.1 hypothetical protein THAOC_35101 [Thalassiosira oceanica]